VSEKFGIENPEYKKAQNSYTKKLEILKSCEWVSELSVGLQKHMLNIE
jgi:hypothetical protein